MKRLPLTKDPYFTKDIIHRTIIYRIIRPLKKIKVTTQPPKPVITVSVVVLSTK